MTNNPGGISQSNSGSMGGGQQGVIGNNNQQTMTTSGSTSTDEQLTTEQVVEMISEIERMIDSTELPEDTKEEAIMYLGAAKKTAEKKEPNKERVKINLEGMAETLEKASKTVDAGNTLWEKAKPILAKLATWLGAVATGSFLGTL